MLDRGLLDPLAQPFDAHKIRQESMGQSHRENEINRIQRDASVCRDFATGDATTPAGSQKEAFQGTIDEFKIDRLGTCPTTPDSPEQCGQEEDGQEDANHQQREKQCIGRQERIAEDRELALRDIEQDARFPIDVQVGQAHEDRDQQETDNATKVPVVTARKTREQPAT